MEKRDYDRQKLLSSLMQIGHGDLTLYEKEGLPAAKSEPELFGHLVTYNSAKSKVKDSKVAFPVIALRGLIKPDRELAENAIANLMLLGPRELYRAYEFNKGLSKRGLTIPSGNRRMLETALKRYLRYREEKPQMWNRAALSNREAMRGLYAVSHLRPAPFAQSILFDGQYPEGSVFQVVRNLKKMVPKEAAAAVLKHKIPFQIAVGALPSIKDENVVLAIIEGMSGNELLNSTKMLKKLGMMESPALKGAYQAALERAKSDTKVNTLKGGKAAEMLEEDEMLSAKVLSVQTAQLEKLGGIEGDWLILGDKSGSMSTSIEVARRIASLIAQQVKGKVYLVFFDTNPMLIDVTGATLDQIQKATERIKAGGSTSIGCGLDYLTDQKISVNGIVVVSDGGDNTEPLFGTAYKKYVKKMDIEPTVYFLHVPGEADALSRQGIQMEKFELGNTVDYYSLPNIVGMLKTSRYTLLDEIMQTPLLTLDGVFA